ncbi:MAG: ABC transporter substrate-binding protein [Acidimicrobiales bacterium]|nr:ABC transporter substrate-binding protein [Acidimicrobiales bacterium]
MRSTSTKRWRFLIALLCAGTLVVAASCSNSGDDESSSDTTEADSGSTDTTAAGGDEPVSVDQPGVTDEEIRFSALGTQANNPLGTCVLDCYTDGIRAYFAYKNAEGGVHGRDLVLDDGDILDDELSNNQARALEIISDNDTFATFSATQVASGWGDLHEAGIPLYVWQIHPAETEGREGIFGQRETVCIECTSRAVALLAQEAEATQVAALGYGVSENSAQCAEAAGETIELYADDIGGDVEVAYVNSDLAFGLPNGIGPEVTAMKNAGVDFVVGCIDLNGMKSLAQEMERQGINDDVTMYHTNTYDQAFVAEADPLFEGDLIGAQFRPFEAESAGSNLDLYHEWMAETGAEESELAMVGWINADEAVTGLELAGADFSRESVIDALNEVTDYTAGGLVPDIDWTRQHSAPTQDDLATHGPALDCLAFVKVVDAEFEVQGDPEAPWQCWSGENRDWSDPEATNFTADGE